MVEIVFASDASAARSDEPAGQAVNASTGRLLDIGLGLVALVTFSPIMLLAALAIHLEDGGPILFAQTRIGQGGKRFRCFKFRSMGVDAEASLKSLLDDLPEARAEWRRDHKLKLDPRITFVGGFLRKYSLDELPQLLNVLAGKMSLVGPRPISQAEVWRYGRRFTQYCALRPGLTGLWQVNGRSDASYRSRVAMDTVYVKSKSLMLDIKILLATIPAVILGRGSY